MFSELLISTCDIETKTLAQAGYEKTASWTVALSGVPTRKDRANGASISDGEKRLNTDDDLFFFEPTVVIDRGDRISYEGGYYDVLRVNKLYDEEAIHHLEVTARYIDHK